MSIRGYNLEIMDMENKVLKFEEVLRLDSPDNLPFLMAETEKLEDS